MLRNKALAPAWRPPIAIFTLAFLSGILSIQWLSALPSAAWLLVLPPLVVLAAWRRGGFVVLLVFALGASWAGVRAGAVLADTLAPGLEGRDLVLTGRVDTIPRPASYGKRFDFIVERASLKGKPVHVPHRIRLRADAHIPIGVGELWRFTARLKRPHGYENPGGFDYEAYLFEHRIRALGYVRSAVRRGGSAPLYVIARTRAFLGARIVALAGSSANAGVFTALVTGERGGIHPRQWDLFRATGTSHLMAISGLHVGMVSGMVFLVASWLWRRTALRATLWPAPRVGAVAAWLGALVYGALAGWSLPTQRALVMLSMVLGGILAARRYRPGTVLGAALLAVLVWDPLSVLAPGFWLSFAAVAAIYLLMYGRGRTSLATLNLVRMQWAIGLVLAPLSLAWFQQLSLSAPLANLLAVPLFALGVVPGTLLSVLIDRIGFPGLAGQMLAAISWCLDRLWDGLTILAHIPLWTGGNPGIGATVAALIGVALVLAPWPLPGRWMGGLCLLPMLFVHRPGPALREMDCTLLDVGQGLAAVVRTRHHVLVFDTGPRFGVNFDTGKAVVVPFLRAAGIDHVDRLVVSHGDNDHIGGAVSLRRLLPVGKVLSGVPRRLHGAVSCHAGQAWWWDGVRFRMLSPTAARPMSHNNHSCVLQVDSRYGSLLLPADIEARRERELVARVGRGLRAQVLVAAHHGSNTSSTPVFLDVVRPQWVLVPAGYHNRYHHPHPAVLARLHKRGVRMAGSADSGAITVRFRPNGLSVSRYRVDFARYWFDRPAFAQSGRSATLAPVPKTR